MDLHPWILQRFLLLFSARDASKVWKRSISTIYYHRHKMLNPHFRQGRWGGRRWEKFGHLRQLIINALKEMKGKCYTRQEIIVLFQGLGIQLSKAWVSRRMKENNLTFKVPQYVQKYKFTVPNIIYYGKYVSEIQTIPIDRLIYLDEARFTSRKLRRRLGIGVIGEPFTVPVHDLPLESYSLILMTSLSGKPISVSTPTQETLTALAFYSFVREMVTAGRIIPGNIVIVDNAATHTCQDAVPFIEVLRNIGIRLIFLPKYSPELNPCELVFAQVKKWIQNHRNPTMPLLVDMCRAFSRVTRENLHNYYYKCIFELKK